MTRAVCVSPGRRPPCVADRSLAVLRRSEGGWFRNGLQVVPLPVQVQDSSHAHDPGDPAVEHSGDAMPGSRGCAPGRGARASARRHRPVDPGPGARRMGRRIVTGPRPDSPGRLGRGFLIGNGGLLLVGVGLVGAAVLRGPRARLRVGVRLLAALGTLLLAPVIISFLRAGGPLAALACALALWTAGAAIVILARASARRIARRLASPPLTPDSRSSAGPRRIALIAIAGIVPTLAGPQSCWSSAGICRDLGCLARLPSTRRSTAPGRTDTHAGAHSGGLAARDDRRSGGARDRGRCPQVPLSPAAELLAGARATAGGLGHRGLWPLHRQLAGRARGTGRRTASRSHRPSARARWSRVLASSHRAAPRSRPVACRILEPLVTVIAGAAILAVRRFAGADRGRVLRSWRYRSRSSCARQWTWRRPGRSWYARPAGRRRRLPA